MRIVFGFVACLISLPLSFAQETSDAKQFIWPKLAPGETDDSPGEMLPMRPQDKPPIIRVNKIRRPSIEVFPATENANGAAMLILPGGGFGRVVPNLEGSEAAEFFGKMGVTSFVLNYRTNESKPKEEASYLRPLQDAQRAMRWIRANADKYGINNEHVGLLAFSAGGQVGATLITADKAAYEEQDSVDQQSFRPDFAMLVYPWQCYDAKTDDLVPHIKVTKETPPTFIVHTHDDRSTSLGAVLIYAGLKRNNVPAELHVYENGGHGYGTRPRPNSNIGTWKDRAGDWIARRLPQ